MEFDRYLCVLFQVLRIARRARHELAGCTILLLDPPANIHSIYNPYQVIPLIDSIRIQDQVTPCFQEEVCQAITSEHVDCWPK